MNAESRQSGPIKSDLECVADGTGLRRLAIAVRKDEIAVDPQPCSSSAAIVSCGSSRQRRLVTDFGSTKTRPRPPAMKGPPHLQPSDEQVDGRYGAGQSPVVRLIEGAMQHRVRGEDAARRETVGQKARVAGLDQLRRQPRDRNRAQPAHRPTETDLVARRSWSGEAGSV